MKEKIYSKCFLLHTTHGIQRADILRLLIDFEMLSRAAQNAFAGRMRPAGRMLCRPVLKTHLFELYPNVYIALRILLTCPVTVASAERSFSKFKLIKTFNRTSMTDSRLSSLAMLSIENDCARSLDYDNVITAFANKKVRSRLFK